MRGIRDELKTIQNLILSGFEDWNKIGKVNVKESGELILFNYTNEAQYEGRWNWFELISRGLIFNRITGECVALPFQKFFNWNERDRPNNPIAEVTEKMDGSLGIMYRDHSEIKIATRGSFDSDQALWATDMLRRDTDYFDLVNNLDRHITLLFEIIYPDNRIVVDYGNLEQLVLIGARDRYTGQDMWYEEIRVLGDRFSFLTPKTYIYRNWTDIIASSENLTFNEEGYVVRLTDGTRLKVKGDPYLLAHRVKTGITFNRALEAYSDNFLDDYIASVPEEFSEQIRAWKDQITERITAKRSKAEEFLRECPKTDRKEQALWIGSHCRDYAPILFKMLDGKNYLAVIYKQIKEEGEQ